MVGNRQEVSQATQKLHAAHPVQQEAEDTTMEILKRYWGVSWLN